MYIFNNEAYVSSAAKKKTLEMFRSHPDHKLPSGNTHFGASGKINPLRQKTGIDALHGVNFEDVMLRTLDNVSGAQLRASDLQKEAIINPGSVDIHDITIAQAEASMALGVTRMILNRLVQGWRDLINTR